MNTPDSVTPPSIPHDLPPQKPCQRTVRWIAGVALTLGLMGDILLRSLPLGINAPLYVGLLCIVMVWGWKRHQEPSPCGNLLVFLWLLSVCLAWRDAYILRVINLITMITLLLIFCGRPLRHELHRGTLVALITNTMLGIGQAISAPLVLIFQDIDWSRSPAQTTHHTNQKKILRGFLIAAPILLVFILLFSVADAIFRDRILTILNQFSDLVLHSEQLAYHTLYSLGFTVMAIFFLRPPFLGEPWKKVQSTAPVAWSLGAIELSVALGSILLLFFCFIVIQFRYLFGGHILVQTLKGLTYATYARKGFFALLLVVAFVHLILMTGAWLTRQADKKTQGCFRWLSLSLILLTSVVFASAFYRLYLYVHAYGLTQARFYAALILIWLGVLFVLLTLKLVTTKWSYETSVYLHTFLGGLLILNAINPDAVIAKINLDRMILKNDLDRAYIEKLSTDAIPTILNYQDSLQASDQLIQQILHKRHADKQDWRSWNYSRSLAQSLVSRQE